LIPTGWQQQVVIKSFRKTFTKREGEVKKTGVAGATIMGDGGCPWILMLNRLADSVTQTSNWGELMNKSEKKLTMNQRTVESDSKGVSYLCIKVRNTMQWIYYVSKRNSRLLKRVN